MSMVVRITFKGEPMYLHTDEGRPCGAIDPCHELDHISYAYLGRDGKVMRCYSEIGTIDDILFLYGDHDDA